MDIYLRGKDIAIVHKGITTFCVDCLANDISKGVNTPGNLQCIKLCTKDVKAGSIGYDTSNKPFKPTSYKKF